LRGPGSLECRRLDAGRRVNVVNRPGAAGGLPVVWPGSVHGLEIGIVGTKGVIDIGIRNADGWKKQLWGPMSNETPSWFDRIVLELD
jgi:hypothetical protein